MTKTLSPFGRLVLDGTAHRSWCNLHAVWHSAERNLGPRCTCDRLTVEDLVAWHVRQARPVPLVLQVDAPLSRDEVDALIAAWRRP